MELLQRNLFEDVAIIGGLIGVQIVYAGNSILLSYLMALGLESFTIVIFSTFATFLILSPIAIYFERFLLSLTHTGKFLRNIYIFFFPFSCKGLSKNGTFLYMCVAGIGGPRNSTQG